MELLVHCSCVYESKCWRGEKVAHATISPNAWSSTILERERGGEPPSPSLSSVKKNNNKLNHLLLKIKRGRFLSFSSSSSSSNPVIICGFK